VSLDAVLGEARACSLCAEHLPLGPRPIVFMKPTARLLIIGQAPGTKVHETGIPWNDPSGDRLRDWLRIDRDTFYDDGRIAIMPMGFCYPGRLPKGGDAPPRPECAPAWHDRLLEHLPNLDLTLLVGSYAQKRYLGAAYDTMTDAVRGFRTHLVDGYLPLPHPSWRTTGWQKRNPWFEADVLPELRARTAPLLRHGQ
jgi:uracil-DNA glycosylase